MTTTTAPRLPLAVKLAYTAFMAVLIPVYWSKYGPTNFLYFCDVALILTLVGVWKENALLVSMPAVGILVPQALWVADFGVEMAGGELTGMTAYMFEAQRPLFLRGLSLFHGWLPFLLVYLVWRLGYDRRALKYWAVLAWGLLLVCYFLMPPPTPNPGLTPVNINYVYGMSDHVAQTWMPPLAWLGLEMLLLPVLFYLPVHWLLARLQERRAIASPALAPALEEAPPA
jgi:hypothetical protein